MTEEDKIYDTLIIGSGPAGLTAAIYNVRADLKTVVIAGDRLGGQLILTTTVDNFPGFPNGTGGVKLMMDTIQQYKNLGGEIRNEIVKGIKPIPNPSLDPAVWRAGRAGRFTVELESGEILQTKAVIVTTGAAAKWLGIAKEKELIGHGVSGCATCDGMFFRNKVVAVVGGGDVACEDADFLTKFATKVYVIHRRNELRAQKAQQKLVLNNPKIEMLWDSEVKEINPLEVDKQEGGEKLSAIKVVNNKSGEERILEVEGLFVAIGRIPATDFVKEIVKLKEGGQIETKIDPNYLTMSSVPGIFAAGDCVEENHRQAIVAAGDGCRAGLEAEKWLKMQEQE